MKKLIANVLFAVFCIGINCNAQSTHTLIVNGKALEGKSVVSISFDGDNAKLFLSDNSSLSERMDNVKILFATDPTGIESTRLNVLVVKELRSYRSRWSLGVKPLVLSIGYKRNNIWLNSLTP